jgi:putative ABC transport system permease protein
MTLRLLDMIRMCALLVFRRRRRYKNVVLGIAFGTAGLIVILSAGNSIEKELMENLDLVGGATLIRLYWNDDDCPHPGEFDSQDLERIRGMEHVIAVSPVIKVDGVQACYKQNCWLPGIVGVEQSYWKMTYASVTSGRPINERDVREKWNVCVVAPDVHERLFAGGGPVGETCVIAGQSFMVVGTLGGVEMRNTAHEIYIPVSKAGNLFPSTWSIKEILVRIDHVSRVEQLKARCLELIGSRHPKCVDCLRVVHFPERVKKVQSVLNNFKILFLAGLVVGLFLGGIGIMKVMLAAVRDRTKEIGLKKAVGAQDSSIFQQFLVEALLIGFSGTFFGTLLSGLAIKFIEWGLDVRISFFDVLPYVIAGVGFGGFLGISSGILPARRASKMDPAEAMRFE